MTRSWSTRTRPAWVSAATMASAARMLPDGRETDALTGPEPEVKGLQADLLRGEGFGPRHRGLARVQRRAIFLH